MPIHVPWKAPTPKARSRAAHAAIKPKKPTIRALVLRAIHSAGPAGLTHEELERLFAGQCKPNSVRTRCSELAKTGVVVDSGESRATTAGNDATVWMTIDHYRAKKGV